ncbi:MAG: 23S rRNA (pseudouridine(1915)-N(3))-methyltransferase RlmH [Gammaproteobacteria bacterium]|nr:23S rRNA (pseudouridine(1915)-N(3))-methyltransferase RlmH [Gammaproteobacteria bacterium]NNJ98427.1 23S rRNA (pseudouridine(1915)-N(3))-methyltransferase RlmH [Gammaproteobacteria bacterium]
MRVYLTAVGHKMPSWVYQACDEYIKRLPPELQIKTIEVPLIKRGKNADIKRIRRDESRKLIAAVPSGCALIALDVQGRKVTTEQLAERLDQWMLHGKDIALLVGGPDGLSDEILQQAEQRLSLSDLTFPHPLVRIIIAEQLYRAWSILSHHPYHRA